jgi:tRNA(Ile2) C34 agmatinyltransferase TiaS
MDRFLREYVLMGLTEIAVLEASFKESDAGYGSHQATATTVARKGKEFVKMSVSEHATFGFGGKNRFRITSETIITGDEYHKLSEGRELIDNPEDVNRVQAEQAALQRRFELENKLSEAAPKCRVCGGVMTSRSGRYGPFWGCNKYPKCDETAKMLPEQRRWYKEWAGE